MPRNLPREWLRKEPERSCNGRTLPNQHQLRRYSRSRPTPLFYKSLLALTFCLLSGRFQCSRSRVLRLVRGDFRFVLKGEADVVQSVQQTVPHELVDRELRAEIAIVTNLTLFQINHNLIFVDLLRALHKF